MLGFLLLVAALGAVVLSAEWHDPSLHSARFVEVEPGVQLEVLDWGGRGQPVLLLAGHGHTGHVFDDFAPHLTNKFHVLALTRRGFGASSQPEHGYDVTTMTRDIAYVIDSLRLGAVHLVGHSIAGDEMTRLAATMPDKVRTLTYLEAAYDRVESQRLEGTFPALPPDAPPSTDDRRSPAGVRAYLARTEILLPEGEIRATRVFASDGQFVRAVTPDRIVVEVAKMVEHPDYLRIRQPILAVFAVFTDPSQLLPRYTRADSTTRAKIDRIFSIWQPEAQVQRERFRQSAPSARVLEIPGASHYVFISHQQAVLKAIADFLAGK